MNKQFEKLDTLKDRLSKIGITIKVAGNYPWLYLSEVNGNAVREKHLAEHGFTIAWYPNASGRGVKFVDNMDYVFDIIRKYK